MSALREAVDGLVAVATEAGLAPDRARDEGMVFAAAIAEAAPRAALDWCAALDAGPTDLAAANAAFFDAASRVEPRHTPRRSPRSPRPPAGSASRPCG